MFSFKEFKFQTCKKVSKTVIYRLKDAIKLKRLIYEKLMENFNEKKFSVLVCWKLYLNISTF